MIILSKLQWDYSNRCHINPLHPQTMHVSSLVAIPVTKLRHESKCGRAGWKNINFWSDLVICLNIWYFLFGVKRIFSSTNDRFCVKQIRKVISAYTQLCRIVVNVTKHKAYIFRGTITFHRKWQRKNFFHANV